MPHKHSKKTNKKGSVPKRIPSNVDYSITSKWDPLPAERSARLITKQGKNSFLKEGAVMKEPDGQKSFASLDKHGNTMLHSAANENNEIFFLNTIKGVKNKNPRNNDGTTPLHLAASKGNLRICELIIEHIEDKNPKNDEGKTPLHNVVFHYSTEKEHLQVCKLIISNIQDANPTDNEGFTPLHYAADQGKLEVCKLLLQNVEDKNPKNNAHQTPLHCVAMQGHQKIFKLMSLLITTPQLRAHYLVGIYMRYSKKLFSY